MGEVGKRSDALRNGDPAMSKEDRRLFVVLCVLSLISAVALVSAIFPARAHQAPITVAQPEGWAYPYACCSDDDCRPVSSGPGGLVHERPEGYVIETTGEVIAYDDRRVKQSPDGLYHWCSISGAADSRTICLFVPPAAF